LIPLYPASPAAHAQVQPNPTPGESERVLEDLLRVLDPKLARHQLRQESIAGFRKHFVFSHQPYDVLANALDSLTKSGGRQITRPGDSHLGQVFPISARHSSSSTQGRDSLDNIVMGQRR